MNFDDLYYLKLAIRLSDKNGVNKYISKCRGKFDSEVYEYISYYCTDINIFKLVEKYIDKTKLNPLIMAKTTFNNSEIFKYFVENSKIDLNQFKDEESIIINALLNKNLTKRNTLFEYLLNNKSLNLNSKNSNSETNSQIILNSNPTDAEGIILEKFENLAKAKTEETAYLFNSTQVLSKDINSINGFIREPTDSIKLNFNDIEYELLKINLKLKKMFSFNSFSLSRDPIYSSLTSLHSSILHNFILNKLLLDKI
jgi:hypothetical protein